MEEKDAIELLGRLEKFMRDTNQGLKDLQIKVYNLAIDIDKLKKKENRIIVSN